MPNALWVKLINELALRGEGIRESGAFLLGRIENERREVTQFIPYDELESGCLDAGWIKFSSVGYRRLWKLLKGSDLQVVADIHTHPGAPFQSDVDQDNPMMPSAGHIGLIVPEYAQGNPRPKDISLYVFLGNKQWTEFKPGPSTQKLYVGFWS